jgi:hypothetical protein
MDDYVIEQATEEQFASMKDEWMGLLESYEDATLFNTWEWQYTWWKTWGKDLEGELYLILARNQYGELVGLAPLYRYKRAVLGGLFNYHKLQFIGSSMNLMPTVRSEYLNFIFASQYQSVVQSLLMYLLSSVHWSKALFSDIRTNSNLFASLTNEYIMGKSYYVRATSKDVGVIINTTESFEGYKKSLGKHTRLVFYNRKKRLENTGKLQIFNNSRLCTRESLRMLNQFHIERRGRHCFDEKALFFHQSLIAMDVFSDNVQFSTISLDDIIISIIYNIDYNGVRYNLQLGFTILEDKKLSMGNLQLGYAIEDAFSATDVYYFDLLAGMGKNSFYKERLKGKSYRLYTLEIIRSPLMRLIYRSYDICRYLTNIVTNRI